MNRTRPDGLVDVSNLTYIGLEAFVGSSAVVHVHNAVRDDTLPRLLKDDGNHDSCCNDAMSIPQVDGLSTEVLRLQNPSKHAPSISTYSTGKRKRDELDSFAYSATVSVEESFTIEAHPSLPHVEAQGLTIRLLLPRSCLPLTYLDSPNALRGVSGGRLFNLHSHRFQCNDKMFSPESTVQVAQSGEDGYLWALERVCENIYAICKLHEWVDLVKLGLVKHVLSRSCSSPARVTQDSDAVSDEYWWRVTAIQSNVKSCSNTAQTPRLQLLKPKPSCIESQTEPHVVLAEEPEIGQSQALDPTFNDDAEKVPDLNQDFESIKIQYQEVLYASRASLAYFAKGPLSRARANVTALGDTKKDRSRHVEFLKSIILPLSSMDRKYRETLPSIIRGLPFGPFSEEESAGMLAAVAKKVQRSKKSLFGRNGLYPGEEANITRWWLGRDVTGIDTGTSDTREDSLRTTILEQRSREIQVQMILVLETLALEDSVPNTSVQEHSRIEEEIESQNCFGTKFKKRQKPQDLNKLLDLLIDKLSIWQSMELEDISAPDDHPSASQRAKGHRRPDLKLDNLRQFCVDVVIPFYGARLPEKSALLCQKLGGAKEPPPICPPAKRSLRNFGPAAKPGASISRQHPRRPRRTLERVMTDEKMTSRRVPHSLVRSTTEPVLPQLKHEGSDVSMSAIPSNKIALSKRYSQREVDMRSASQAREIKQKKKACIEHELRGAIATVTKPNPRMAVKELIEATEGRLSGSHSRKSKHPIRNPFALGVQVMATPSKDRQRDAFGRHPCLNHDSGAEHVEIEDIPPSSIHRIPSSTLKYQGPRVFDLRETGGSDKGGRQVNEQTPSKGRSKAPDSMVQSKISLSTPRCHFPAPEALQHSRGKDGNGSKNGVSRGEMSHCMRPVDTPVPEAQGLTASPQDEEIDIYASLEWDRDYDDVL